MPIEVKPCVSNKKTSVIVTNAAIIPCAAQPLSPCARGGSAASSQAHQPVVCLCRAGVRRGCLAEPIICAPDRPPLRKSHGEYPAAQKCVCPYTRHVERLGAALASAEIMPASQTQVVVTESGSRQPHSILSEGICTRHLPQRHMVPTLCPLDCQLRPRCPPQRGRALWPEAVSCDLQVAKLKAHR